MKKGTRKVLTMILLAVFLVGLAGVARSLIGYGIGEKDYSAAEQLAAAPVGSEQEKPSTQDSQQTGQEESSAAEQPDPESSAEQKEIPLPEVLQEINLAALQEVNSDVLGWIQIPGTRISYPLLQCADNDYYLDHTWQKKNSAVGAIFMDYRNSGDRSDFNTIIYGHNMRDDSMFGELHSFRNKAFLDTNPYVNIIDGEALYAYRIFAAYEVGVSTAESYQLRFSGEDSKQAFIDRCLALSAVNTGVVPGVEDQIITLSTCTGRGHETRWVVQAVLEAESAEETA